VFALEFLAMTLAFSLGGLVAGLVYDRTGDLALTTWTLSALVLAAGAFWTLSTRRLVRAERARAPERG
jgi:predicted MFS family arabinose efflux permease